MTSKNDCNYIPIGGICGVTVIVVGNGHYQIVVVMATQGITQWHLKQTSMQLSI